MLRTSVILVALLASPCIAFAQDDPCSNVEMDYHSPTPDRDKHLLISMDPSGTYDATKKITNDTGAGSWFVTMDPVYTKSPPWNTTIFVGNRNSDKPLLKISISDHGNALAAKWITDDLLFVHVVWGRFGESDWIFSVGRKKVVYDELANSYAIHNCMMNTKDSKNAK
jgi:hypothetical protein